MKAEKINQTGDKMKKALTSFLDSITSDSKMASPEADAIKQSIVMKLLFLLGWDIFDVREVKANYRLGKHAIDFCLCLNESPRILIQVVPDRGAWPDVQAKLAEASSKKNIDYFILTDGKKWDFYLPNGSDTAVQSSFCSLDVSADDPLEPADLFMEFLDAGKVSVGQALKSAEAIVLKSRQQAVSEVLPDVWQDLLATPHELIVGLIRETVEKTCGVPVDAATVVDFLTEWSSSRPTQSAAQPTESALDVAEIETPVHRTFTSQAISCFSFKDKVYPVKSWGDIVARLCEALRNEHRKDIDKLLWHSVGGKYYFSKNKDELKFSQKINSTDIFVETQLSPNEAIKAAHSILAIYGFTSSDFLIPLN